MTTYILFTASCLALCTCVTIAVSFALGFLLGRDRARMKAFLATLDARAAERRAVSDACEAKIDASEALRREATPAPLMPNPSPRRAFLARLDELLTRYRPMTIAEFKARNALLLSSSDARAEAAEAASMGWANVEHLIRTGGSAASLSAAVSAAIELTDSAYVGHGSSGSPSVGPVPIDPGVAGPTVGPVPIDPGSRLTPAS